MGKRVQELKESIIGDIRSLLEKHNVEEILWSDVNTNCSPIIMEDKLDANNNFIVDEVTNEGVWGSSCCNEYFWNFDDLSVDLLEGIFDDLSKYWEDEDKN